MILVALKSMCLTLTICIFKQLPLFNIVDFDIIHDKNISFLLIIFVQPETSIKESETGIVIWQERAMMTIIKILKNLVLQKEEDLNT